MTIMVILLMSIMVILLMVIVAILLMFIVVILLVVIGGYYTNGYLWLFYQWILVFFQLVDIGVYYWLLY